MRPVPPFPAENAHIDLPCFHLQAILSELSCAIVTVIEDPSHPQRCYLAYILRGLTRWTARPPRFSAMACEWCSAICGEHQELEMGEKLLLLSLETVFRYVNPRRSLDQIFFYPQHHQYMADIVFWSQQDEAIADLLRAFIQHSTHHPFSAIRPLDRCAKHLVDLPSLDSSPRLRSLVIQSIELIGHRGFREVGLENIVRLLNHLGVGVDDINSESSWIDLLVGIIESHEGRDRLAYPYWEFLAEFSLPYSQHRQDLSDYYPQIMIILQGIQEWDRLACWIYFVWLEWSLPPGEELEDLERTTVLLFHQRPDSIQKFKEWRGRSQRYIPMAFREICGRGHLEAEQRGVLP